MRSLLNVIIVSFWAVLLSSCSFDMLTKNSDPSAEHPVYQAYWLTLDNGYVDLLLSKVPIEKLVGVNVKLKQGLLDSNAILLNTYAKDSILNCDQHPLKVLEGLERVDAESVVISGKSFKYEPADISDAIRLLENPLGTLPVHRIYPPLLGQERVLKQLLLVLKAQRQSTAKKPAVPEASEAGCTAP